MWCVLAMETLAMEMFVGLPGKVTSKSHDE
jgi:hypothetical protein